MERTLVLIKPDGVQRGLMGEIIGRLERRGLKLVAMKMMMVSEDLATHHYEEHKGRPFYPGLISFITSSPVIAMVWEGGDAIKKVRQTMGATDPAEAAPGTIRADLALDKGMNLVHGSDKPESAAREIGIFFREDELVEWSRDVARWLYSPD